MYVHAPTCAQDLKAAGTGTAAWGRCGGSSSPRKSAREREARRPCRFRTKGNLAFLGRRESFVGGFRVSSAVAARNGISAFGVAHLCVEPQSRRALQARADGGRPVVPCRKSKSPLARAFELDGAGNRSRTCDLRITNAPLYQLSYSGEPRIVGSRRGRGQFGPCPCRGPPAGSGARPSPFSAQPPARGMRSRALRPPVRGTFSSTGCRHKAETTQPSAPEAIHCASVSTAVFHAA